MVNLFGVTSYDIDGGRVFVLRGELDASTCPGLSQLLAAPPGSRIVLDLSHLNFMDSSGLGAIHSAWRAASKEGGSLVLCRPNTMIQRILEITGLDMWLAEWDPQWDDSSDEETLA
jgi:anti-sigma B factor antagonist